jgi:hypothetical protein
MQSVQDLEKIVSDPGSGTLVQLILLGFEKRAVLYTYLDVDVISAETSSGILLTCFTEHLENIIGIHLGSFFLIWIPHLKIRTELQQFLGSVTSIDVK